MLRSVTRCAGLLLVVPLLVAPGRAAAQQQGAPVLKTGAAELEISGRVQTQFNTTTVESQPETQWLLRRVRLEARVKINDVVSGKVSPDFAGDRVSVKDAYLRLSFAPALNVLAGKAYRPFSLLEQTSSTRILPIERGLAIRGVNGVDHYELVHDLGYSDRDVGLQLLGEPKGAPLGLAYAAGVFAGPADGRVGNRSPAQYAARLTLAPAPQVRVGAGWSSRGFATRPTGSTAVAVERGHALEVDLELGGFDPGLHLLAEVAAGDADPFTGSEFVGAQGWLGYRTGAVSSSVSAVEPVLRVSYGSVEGGALDGRGGTLLTPGLNVYFGGLNRFMVNYDFWDGERGAGEGSFKAMFQLAF